MIVADTGAMLALLDAGDDNHEAVREMYLDNPAAWILPRAVLPELDYLVAAHLGPKAQAVVLEDLAGGAFSVDWG